jgi:hypothetical protein
MSVHPDSRAARLWSNAVLMVVGLLSIGVGAWPDPVAVYPPARSIGPSWAVYSLAGALTLMALLTAQRRQWRGLARFLTLAACAVLGYGVATFRTTGWWLWATTVLPAVALLIAVPFIGPMPRATALPTADE